MREASYLLVAFIEAWLLVSPMPAQEPGNRANTAVSTAMQSRQDAVKTLDVKLARIEITSPGGASAQVPIPALKPKSPIPAEKTTLESTSRLVLNENLIRYEDNHPAWHMPQGKLDKRSLICCFDGETGKMFFPTGLAGEGITTGVITRTAQLDFVMTRDLIPLRYTFRGAIPALSGKWLDEMRPTGTSIPIDGVRCDEYTINYGDTIEHLWFDTTRAYTIRRISLWRQRKLIDQTDIAYQPHTIAGWMPVSWVRNQFGPNGSLLITNRMTIVESFVNDKQPKDQFSMFFPAGTKVIDNRNNKWYRVRANGVMQEIDIFTDQDQSESVSQPGDAWYRRQKWFLTSICIAVVILASCLVIRYMRRLNSH